MPLSVYRRGKHYWVRGTIPGQRAIRKSLHTRNAEVAHRRAAKLELGLDSGDAPLTWDEFSGQFLAQHCGRTRAAYAGLLSRVSEAMRARGLDYVHEASSLVLESHVYARGLSANSLRREIGRLRSIWAWALKHKVAHENIASLIKMPAEAPSVTLPFSPDELDRLEAAITATEAMPTLVGRGVEVHGRLWAMYQVMRSTGIRVSDLVRLRPSQIVGDHLVLEQFKTGGQVRIPLSAEARRALSQLPVRPSGYWFWTGDSFKAACDGVWRSFARLGARAGVANVHPHRFRDTFAVNLLLAGADIRLVSRLLGHRGIQTTEKHYAPWVQGFQDQADAAVRRAEDSYQRRATAARPSLLVISPARIGVQNLDGR